MVGDAAVRGRRVVSTARWAWDWVPVVSLMSWEAGQTGALLEPLFPHS